MVSNKLRKLETEFKKGRLKKEDYIRKMHAMHNILWHYLDFIKGRNVSSIEISKEHIMLTTKNGIKMICDSEDERTIPVEILNFGDHEAEELCMIRKFLCEDSVLLDIGANIGWYCLNLAGDVPKGRILAFEPIPKTYNYLERNLVINNLKNVELYNIGLSDEEEKAEFFYDPRLSGATSLRDLHGDRKKCRIKCRVTTLDKFSKGVISAIDFIKCDVEGAELFVIKGGLNTIRKDLPVIFLELLRKWSAKFGYHPNKVISTLNKIGYRCYYARGSRLVPIGGINEETKATNFYFLHPVKHKGLLEKLV